MTPYALRQAALDMDISYHSAVVMRCRYLCAQMQQCEEWVEGDAEMPQVMTGECLEELGGLVRPLKVAPNTYVTPEMIERARGVPVTRLLEFKHGRATAFCHEDKRPSLYVGSRLNIVCCPVCAKTFDAIAVHRALTGVGFKDAVLALCG